VSAMTEPRILVADDGKAMGDAASAIVFRRGLLCKSSLALRYQFGKQGIRGGQ